MWILNLYNSHLKFCRVHNFSRFFLSLTYFQIFKLQVLFKLIFNFLNIGVQCHSTCWSFINLQSRDVFKIAFQDKICWPITYVICLCYLPSTFNTRVKEWGYSVFIFKYGNQPFWHINQTLFSSNITHFSIKRHNIQFLNIQLANNFLCSKIWTVSPYVKI